MFFDKHSPKIERRFLKHESNFTKKKNVVFNISQQARKGLEMYFSL